MELAMQSDSLGRPVFFSLAFGALMGSQVPSLPLPVSRPPTVIRQVQPAATCQKTGQQPNFFAFGGGPVPEANEIAIEKNILYFHRTLSALGYKPADASTFFANGNNREATVRYIDAGGQQQFKVPEIPYLKGPSTLANLQGAIQQVKGQNPDSIFFYFTGHGIPNPNDIENNAFLLWNQQSLTVQGFSRLLDQLPHQTSVVTMMSQCFAGSFANMIYEGGDPKRPVALQTRCGFFATVKTRPSVGCTPAVNEADYRDYSSSFFAGLSGRSRIGQPVASADYNKDGKVSYAEAHAFAKVDEKTTDWPISTSEAWLQSQATESEQKAILGQPMVELLQTARPEQSYVVNSIAKLFGLNLQKSFRENINGLAPGRVSTGEQEAYIIRLGMELINIGKEKQIRSSPNPAFRANAIATLDRLLNCESGSWK